MQSLITGGSIFLHSRFWEDKLDILCLDSVGTFLFINNWRFLFSHYIYNWRMVLSYLVVSFAVLRLFYFLFLLHRLHITPHLVFQ